MGPTVERTCERCGVAFAVLRKNLVSPSRGLYCSRPCANGARKQQRETCIGCGKGLDARRRGSARKYCSHSCYAEHYKGVPKPHTPEHGSAISAAKKGIPNPAARRPRTIRVCENCRGPFEMSNGASREYRARRRFCSYQCFSEHRRLHPEEHRNYRGGRWPHYGPNWPEQARRARRRDGDTCQDCGLHQSAPALHVHHLTPRRLFGDSFIAANHLDNLITVCLRCHAIREAKLSPAFQPR